MPLWPDLNCHRDGRGHVQCNTLAASYDDYTSKTKGYGGTKGKGSETGCPLDFYGVGHVCVITTPEDPGVLFDEMAQVDYLTECPHVPNVKRQNVPRNKMSPRTKCLQVQNVPACLYNDLWGRFDAERGCSVVCCHLFSVLNGLPFGQVWSLNFPLIFLAVIQPI